MVTSLLYGLYAGAVSIALTLLAYFTGIWKADSNTWLSYLALPFMILFIYLAAQERKREDYGGTMTYGQGVGTGVLVGLFSGLLMAIFMWVYLTNINPEFIDFMANKQEVAMRASKNMDEASVQKGLDWMRKLFIPFAIGGTLLWNVFFATLVSLIVAIFTRTKENDVIVTPAAPIE
ncbi:MAG: DUF4199 domain-containing protein [Bacteroidota bacterium]|nr:DUF4199 domain-containing protein [Bacteroidota bacterium]MDP4232892.1 DUF4199 domain-containing protein [Bacteroidota bacterium]MDP4241936.1 DUF4199 domain-containing protein [Bacteroidota bacterium]MDP4286839.1 DUF4199 domain-containing protein [Bacteroidota bacterium]